MQSFLDAFRAMVDALRNDPRIDVTRCVIAPPRPEAEVRELAASYGLSSAVMQLWVECDGIDLRWQMRGRSDVGGACALVGLTGTDGAPIDLLGAFMGARESGTFCPVDLATGAGLILDGSDNPPMWLRSQNDDLTSLGIDLARYLELLLRCRGFFDWETAIAHDRARARSGPRKLSDPLAKMIALAGRVPRTLLLDRVGGIAGYRLRHVAPDLFPDLDLSAVLSTDYRDADRELAAALEPSAKAIVASLSQEAAVFRYEGLPFSDEHRIWLQPTRENLAKVEVALIRICPELRVGSVTDVPPDWSGTRLWDPQHGSICLDPADATDLAARS